MPDVLGFITYMRGQRGDMVQTEVKPVESHISFISLISFYIIRVRSAG